MNEEILRVEELSVSFRQYVSFFQMGLVTPIEKLNLTIQRGEITVVVGQSGSGKSLLAHAIMGILPSNACVGGKIYYKGEPLTHKRYQAMDKGEIVLIPQSVNYLDPLMTVGKQIKSLVWEGNPERVMEEALARFELSKETADKYPFELSGGMARRVLLALAMVQNPQLIIADEPTPGLDTDLVNETISAFLKLKEAGHSQLIITHDLHVATQLADKIIFFKDGRTICEVPRKQFINNSTFAGVHPYAKQLFSALPQNDFLPIEKKERKEKEDHVLEAKGLYFSYGNGPKVIDNVNFTVKTGEIVGLTGKSGRGKTTLSRLLSGYLKPSAGTVTIDGVPLDSGKRTYYPVQLILQHPEKSVDPKWKMSEILAESVYVEPEVKMNMGIQDKWLSRYPQELSGGELQRFSITRVLHRHTKFLIADESTAMFDAYTQAQVWKVIVEYVHEHHLGLVLISHDQALLERLCDRVVRYV